jgi:hypothetical protein
MTPPRPAEQQVTVTVDLSQLRSYSDSHLAGLWHLAQLNPAPLEDEAAADLAAKIGYEIISRWLQATKPELYHHQARHPYWWALTRMASFREGQWVPDPEKLAKLDGGQPS